jgi:23S rRNA pseudouridine1911/1915/1917 synthase
MTEAFHIDERIPDHEVGLRLDRWLVTRVPGWSRSQLQQLIEHGAVRVNGRAVSAHVLLRANDRVEANYVAPPIDEPSAWNAIRCMAEEPDFLVVEKPAGILAHATPTSHEKTLSDWVAEHYPEVRGVGDDPARPGLVHRLDRNVSGLLVIARTPESFENLKKQFQDRTIEKTYLALVHGVVQSDGEVNYPIARSHTDRKRMAAGPRVEGRNASTAYIVERRYSSMTLLSVHPKTGRMHQIRVHLRAIGHPIVGDQLYETRDYPLIKLGRIFLHASELSFFDQQGQRQHFRSPLPGVLEDYLARLDGKALDR